jgi:hypothetical protein
MIKRLDEWQKEQRELADKPEAIPQDAQTAERMAHVKKSLDEAHGRWRWHYLLRDFPQKHLREASLILDNQSQFPSRVPDDDFSGLDLMDLTARVLRHFVAFDLVSVQPLRGPTDNVFYTKFKYNTTGVPTGDSPQISLLHESRDVVARTRKIATFNDAVKVCGKVHPAVLAEDIRNRITQEILTDLRNNCGTVSKRQVQLHELDWERVYVDLVCMSGVIHRKTLRGGTDWLVASPNLAKLASKSLFSNVTSLDVDSLREVTQIGTLNSKWRLYVNPQMTGYSLICGAYQPGNYYPCYVYSPYIFAGPTPGLKDEAMTALPGILTRYGKILPPEGGKFYGKIDYEILPYDAKTDVK